MELSSITPSFDDWIRCIFDNPFDDQSLFCDMDLKPERVVTYATKLFENAEGFLAKYTDAQVNQGLWNFINECQSPLYALRDTSIPLDDRLCCVKSIFKLFEQCFARRCSPHLSCIDELGADILNRVCYMWWDIFPISGQPENALMNDIDNACLLVMENTLGLNSIACQESALHGLGHWELHYKDRCHLIISNFVRQNPDIRPELLEYAKHAKSGHVN